MTVATELLTAGRPMNRAVSAFVKLVRAVRWEGGRIASAT
jgi:hypothetical protein